MSIEYSASGAKALKRSPLFLELDDEEFTIVLSYLFPVLKKEGETIFKEGDTGKSMFILFLGELRAFGKQSDGNQRWLFDIKQQGDFFGEMSIIDHGPRSATINAVKDSIIMMLKEDQFYKIITRHPEIGLKILRAISMTHSQWLDQSAKSYSDLIRWGEAARKRAITDEMTGLYNRRFLEDSIKERFSNRSMNFRIMSLLMMDLDRIHNVNDRYGTKAGDLIITEAAVVIRSCLRPGDIPARLSGDEFAILLPDTDKTDATRVAERIRENVSDKQIEIPSSPNSNENVLITTHTSIGIALAPVHANTTEGLIHTSDYALRRAKELGRNRVEIYAS